MDNPAARGAMLIPIIAGSDKTTVSVAIGYQEYHPLYISVGNISNIMWRSHSVGIKPIVLLPIPKSEILLQQVSILSLVLASKKHHKRPEYQSSANNFIIPAWRRYSQYFIHP
jgi:hypothetical protein